MVLNEQMKERINLIISELEANHKLSIDDFSIAESRERRTIMDFDVILT